MYMDSLKVVTLRTLGKLCSGMVEQNESVAYREWEEQCGFLETKNNRQGERMGPGPGSSHPAVSTSLKLLVMLITQGDSIGQCVPSVSVLFFFSRFKDQP